MGLVDSLTVEEKTIVLNYLGGREDSPELGNIIKKSNEEVPYAYRGVMYQAEDLMVGSIYSHWNAVSSWSVSMDVALEFANNLYVPEDMLEDVANEYEISLEEALEGYFIKVVFVCEKAEGFMPNHHFEHNFIEEEELMVLDGEFRINSYVETDGIYYVKVAKVVSESVEQAV